MSDVAEEPGRLIPLDGGSSNFNESYHVLQNAGKTPWKCEVQGELPCADDVIRERDGVFMISDMVMTGNVVQNASFKQLVDSIMNR